MKKCLKKKKNIKAIKKSAKTPVPKAYKQPAAVAGSPALKVLKEPLTPLPELKEGAHYKKLHLIKSELERMHSCLARVHDLYHSLHTKAASIDMYEPFIKSCIMKLELIRQMLQIIDNEFSVDASLLSKLSDSKAKLGLAVEDFDHKINESILRNVYTNIKEDSTLIGKEIELGKGIASTLGYFISHLQEMSNLPKYEKEHSHFYKNLSIELRLLKESTKRFIELLSLEKHESLELQQSLLNWEKTLAKEKVPV